MGIQIIYDAVELPGLIGLSKKEALLVYLGVQELIMEYESDMRKVYYTILTKKYKDAELLYAFHCAAYISILNNNSCNSLAILKNKDKI
jgi:hypothetical protein